MEFHNVQANSSGLAAGSVPFLAVDPEHRVPGRGDERDAHGGESMQAMFGFGFEEHGQRFTPILAGEENLVRSQLHVHAMWGEPNLARRPPRSSRGPGPLDPQAFDRPEFVATASRGIKSVPTQHT